MENCTAYGTLVPVVHTIRTVRIALGVFDLPCTSADITIGIAGMIVAMLRVVALFAASHTFDPMVVAVGRIRIAPDVFGNSGMIAYRASRIASVLEIVKILARSDAAIITLQPMAGFVVAVYGEPIVILGADVTANVAGQVIPKAMHIRRILLTAGSTLVPVTGGVVGVIGAIGMVDHRNTATLGMSANGTGTGLLPLCCTGRRFRYDVITEDMLAFTAGAAATVHAFIIVRPNRDRILIAPIVTEHLAVNEGSGTDLAADAVVIIGRRTLAGGGGSRIFGFTFGIRMRLLLQFLLTSGTSVPVVVTVVAVFGSPIVCVIACVSANVAERAVVSVAMGCFDPIRAADGANVPMRTAIDAVLGAPAMLVCAFVTAYVADRAIVAIAVSFFGIIHIANRTLKPMVTAVHTVFGIPGVFGGSGTSANITIGIASVCVAMLFRLGSISATAVSTLPIMSLGGMEIAAQRVPGFLQRLIDQIISAIETVAGNRSILRTGRIYGSRFGRSVQMQDQIAVGETVLYLQTIQAVAQLI